MSYNINNTAVISDTGNIAANIITAELIVANAFYTTESTIGTAGGQGFGVGVYPTATLLPSELSRMTGTDDVTSINYGNYTTTNGSIMVFIPAFYYRIGHANNATYTDYGVNSVSVKAYSAYASEDAANDDGYALHRAFIDGGQIKSGFFIDKYLASKDGTTSCKSIASIEPISLTTNTNYNTSNGMTGCTGILADAVVLSKARGSNFQCASIFQYSALGLLQLAHAQASTSTTYCAWFDSAATKTTNFPKGCNNNALADHIDGTVTYTRTAYVSDNKPITRANANFAKTTHNGQENGVADLNGSLWQVMVGMTSPGANATDSTQIASGDVYVLKESVTIANMTGGYGTSTDFWGTAANLGTNYTLQSGLMVWGSGTGWSYWGSGNNKVLDPATSRTSPEYLRTACGLPATTASCDETGMPAMGNDGIYKYNLANMFPLAAGDWSYSSYAGVFCRSFYGYRSNGFGSYGFRASAYFS